MTDDNIPNLKELYNITEVQTGVSRVSIILRDVPTAEELARKYDVSIWRYSDPYDENLVVTFIGSSHRIQGLVEMYYEFLGNFKPSTEEEFTVEHTNRSFAFISFKDRNGVECSVQKSSLAFEDCIWFGCNAPNPRHFVPGEGWIDLTLPDNTLCDTRMHLSREHVKALLPALQKFAETGEIE
jgi:hypothetical protein